MKAYLFKNINNKYLIECYIPDLHIVFSFNFNYELSVYEGDIDVINPKIIELPLKIIQQLQHIIDLDHRLIAAKKNLTLNDILMIN